MIKLVHLSKGRGANQASGFRDGSAAALVAERQKLPRTFFDQLQTAPTLVQGHAAIRSEQGLARDTFPGAV